MRYVAKDLAEIADVFEGNATRAGKWAETTKSAHDRKTSETEAKVWQQAAAFLRDTEIAPK